MNTTETTIGCLGIMVWLTGVLLSIGIPVATIYLVIHFARKFW